MDKIRPKHNRSEIKRNIPKDLTHIILELAKQVGVGEYDISEEDRGTSDAVDRALSSGIYSIVVTDPVGDGEYRLRINDGESIEKVDSTVEDAWSEVLTGMSDAVIALAAVLDLKNQVKVDEIA